MKGPLAHTPEPPYWAVIFTSIRDEADDGYGPLSDRMNELASQQPGFLGIESTRGADGLGITVSYWASEETMRAWRANAEHSVARRKGREGFYRAWVTRVCKVERAYAFELGQDAG
jgi:heme-degrading monooxygenase HmoA